MAKTRKLPMKKRETKKQRSVSFTKRRYGLFNKAAELFMLCDAQLALLVSSPCSRKVYSFGHPSVDVILDAFLENHLPIASDGKVKQRALSLLNEIKGLERDIKSSSTQRNKNLENVASGFSSVFECFENSQSIEELRPVVNALEKLVDEAKSRANNSVSCVLRNENGGDGVVQIADDSSLITTNGFCSLNQTDYISSCNISDTSPTAKIDSNNVLTLQDSDSVHNSDRTSVLPLNVPIGKKSNNLLELPESTSWIHYSGMKGKQVDSNIITDHVHNSGCVNGYKIIDGKTNSGQDENWDWANFSSSDITYQTVPAGNNYEDLLDWLFS
ncbi:MADS-box protein SVP [Ricinus communis]|uniref:Mads box protein, putative n=1 Tax=Ricinus communis TaxID=3988 RepID=B9T159_RICCO|nr:MADS-box protein SVP [Ricinus communis]EEF30413.1 mads box protein, putative [Ricinus communis]|eukprot:XP_025015356.1 MADS-box protein SVP-like [Ricinus communis]